MKVIKIHTMSILCLILCFAAECYSKNSEEMVNSVVAGDAPKIQRFLLKGADPNSTSDNMTALMLASQFNKIEIVELLLENDADPNMADPESGSPLTLASMSGNTEVVKLLLEAGADVNYRVPSGWSSLMFAANEGNVDIVIMLLEKGAETSFSDTHGWTALKLAKRSKQQQLIELLQ